MTKADLSDMLLDKMPDSSKTYVQYVRAFTDVHGSSTMDDGASRGEVLWTVDAVY